MSGQARSPWSAAAAAGLAFCGLQVALALVRFGGLPSSADAPSMLSGLAYFFVAGALAYLMVRILLKGATGPWRRKMLVAAAVATPFALLMSLVGGLFGPVGVVAYALVPYLLLVGIPVAGRKLWRRARNSQSDCCS